MSLQTSTEAIRAKVGTDGGLGASKLKVGGDMSVALELRRVA